MSSPQHSSIPFDWLNSPNEEVSPLFDQNIVLESELEDKLVKESPNRPSQ